MTFEENSAFTLFMIQNLLGGIKNIALFNTGNPRIRASPFKVVLDLESFFCDQALDYILNFTNKSPTWEVKEVIA